MKELPESPTTESVMQDKKRTSTETDANIISANNSSGDFITIIDEKQSRINTTVTFFNILFGKITAEHFAYLWTKQRGIFSFQINEESQRMAMAIKAVELSNCGVDIWHSVNPVYVRPTDGKRGDETVVSFQTAIIVDIDICSDAHKSDNLTTSFEEAKSFLPFTSSI